MRTLLAIGVFALCALSSAAAGPVEDALALAVRIETRASDHRLTARHPQAWGALEARLERQLRFLEPLRGRRLTGELSRAVATATDELRQIDVETTKLIEGAETPRKEATAGAASSASTGMTPVGTTVSVGEVAFLEEICRRVADDLRTQGKKAPPELARALEDARRVIAHARTAGAYVTQMDLQRASNGIRIASIDPCEDRARRAYLNDAMGNRRAAYELFQQIAANDCFDPTLSRAAIEFISRYEAEPAPAPPSAPPSAPAPSAPAPSAPALPQQADIPRAAPVTPPASAVVPRASSSSDQTPTIALDVWQSAWADFAEVHLLTDYVRRNGITSINLNIGRAITPATMAAAFAQLQPLVKQLRAAGVQEVRYMYAELNYPIAAFAEFLARYPEAGIDTLVDDSEFTDNNVARFASNLTAVRSSAIKYSAFITLESVGNSGVSDATREWAIEHVDEPILMSYFGCSLDKQKATLARYLQYADRIGRKRAVRVAILLGTKSVGRERSCERELGAAELQRFLRELDEWARGHVSYAGLVLETNLQLPRYDIVAQP